MAKHWTQNEIDLLKVFLCAGYSHEEIATKLGRSKKSINVKASRLKLSSTFKNKDIKEYIKALPEDIILISGYVGVATKAVHMHTICNKTWEATPQNILAGTRCPYCAKYGFNEELPAELYLVYFKYLDLYKIGISNNLKKRLSTYNYIPELILSIRFNLGKDARELERIWLKNVLKLKVNTGKLNSGNTETFKI